MDLEQASIEDNENKKKKKDKKKSDKPEAEKSKQIRIFLTIDQKKILNKGILFTLMERATGIGPVSQPWEGRVLPLNYTRT